MVALVHKDHAHRAGKLVQLHAVQALYGGDGQLGAAALAFAGEDSGFPVVQSQPQLGTFQRLLCQIQRVGDPEGRPPQPGNERHADLGLARTAGRDQHPLMPLAGERRIDRFLLVVPQGKAGGIKGARLAL